jgi:hypothetical protein
MRSSLEGKGGASFICIPDPGFEYLCTWYGEELGDRMMKMVTREGLM